MFRNPPLDKRAWLIPDAELLAVLARSNRELQLHRVDVEQLAREAAADVLLIASEPPTVAKSGEPWRYALSVLSSSDDVQHHLIRGPNGMRMDDAGVLTWQVPAGQPEGMENVVVSVTGANRQEVFQAFSLVIEEVESRQPEVNLTSDSVEVIEVIETPASATRPFEVLRPGPLPAIPSPQLGQDPSVIQLDEEIENLVPGGAGRYLVLYFRKRGEVAVFDVSQAKILYRIPVQDAQVHMAASLDKLVIVLAEQRIALRYDLATGQREQVTRLSGERPIMKAAMGSASHGPLITGSYSRWAPAHDAVFYDLQTLEPLPVTGGWSELFGADHYLRAMRDGTMFGGAVWHSTRRAVWVQVGEQLIELPDTWKAGQTPEGIDYDPVTPEGEVFFRQILLRHRHEFRPSWTLLPERGDYYLKFSYSPPKGIFDVKFCLIGEPQPLGTLEGVTAPNESKGVATQLPPDRRIHLIPDAKLVVTVPLPADRLVLQQVDVSALAAESPVDYLAIHSKPPQFVQRGNLLRYDLQVVSKDEHLQYGVELGPDAMTLSPTGELRWKVPVEARQQEEQVVLSVRDGTGQERLQSFTLKVQEPSILHEPTGTGFERRYRLWIDRSGKFRTQAALLEVLEDESVRLQQSSGAVIRVPVERLSKIDRAFVRQRTEQTNAH